MSNAQVRDYLAGRRELTIGEGDDALTIVYRPGRVNSGDYGKQLERLGEEGANLHAIAVYSVCTLVSDWDLTGPIVIDRPKLDRKGREIRDAYGVAESEEVEIVTSGQKVPLKSDVVQYLATPLLTLITRAIGEDIRPDPKPGS